MGQHEAEAQRIVEHVLAAKAAMPESAKPIPRPPNTFGDEEVAPIRDFMVGLSEKLASARAYARVAYSGPDHIFPQMRDDRYSLTNNAQQNTIIITRFFLYPDGMVPVLMVTGLDQEGQSEIDALRAADKKGWLRPTQAGEITLICARFLERFLVSAVPLEGDYFMVKVIHKE